MLAERARRLQPSPTLAIAARARALRAQGIDVISFSAGEPDFDTPERVKAAAVRAIAEGRTKYTFQGQCTSNPASVAQWAAVEALGGPQDDVAKMAGEFDRRRRAIVEGLNRIPGLRCLMPHGAFYAFAEVSGLFGRRWRDKPLQTSADVTGFLLEEARVAVVPGADFGSDRHVHLSYACGLDTIHEGLRRIDAACARLER